jgi:hypothetical protein
MIRVDLRSSAGEILGSVTADPDFDPVLAEIDRSSHPILGHLDPYGDTVLNRMQVASLIAEISRVRGEGILIREPFARELVELCEECLRRPHRFIWFIGE